MHTRVLTTARLSIMSISPNAIISDEAKTELLYSVFMPMYDITSSLCATLIPEIALA